MSIQEILTGNNAAAITKQQKDNNQALYSNLNGWMEKHNNIMVQSEQIYTKADSLFEGIEKQYNAIDTYLQEGKISEDTALKYTEKFQAIQTAVEQVVEYAEKIFEARKEKVGDFDFMQGKDAADNDSYEEQSLSLARGDIDSRDIDNDGNLSYDEYMASELEGISEEDDMYLQVAGMGDRMFSALDENQDGTISSEEMKDYYQSLDECDGTKDGKINIDSATAFNNYLIDLDYYEEEGELA